MQFSLQEVASHNSAEDCWLVIDDHVYDVTRMLHSHPGGQKVLLKEGGKDASEKFKQFHGKEILRKAASIYEIGTIKNDKPPVGVVTASAQSKPNANEFGEMLPYSDPNWYQGFSSPYYKKSHVDWRKRVRDFVEEEIIPNCSEWDNSKEYKLPKELYVKFAKAGLLPGVVGAPWPKEYASTDGPSDFDAFHELILIDELGRCGSGGVLWGLFEGIQIGLPPIINFGTKYLKDRVVGPCLSGQKLICLCISEPWAGSDVANLRTTARKEGDFYIVNGAKKWITNGIFSDFFTVAVRTGGKGMGGLSLLLLEKGMPGLSCRHMKCSGVWPSGTTYVTLEDVKVPASNLIGKEGEGFKMIMRNFNHERWGFVVQANRLARVCLEDAFNHALKRDTFGKKLADHQVIRWKLAEMARQIDATHAWLEQVTYQMANAKDKKQSDKILAGPIALLKAHSTKTLEYCAREAAQIFGGASYVRSGVGERVERIYREVRAYAIPGGSEEIMLDFAARQAIKKARKQMRSSL
mmetsp:Transcript_10785/g.15000  ORF Transcript_10785/g.15000 Transcript_10785/m.15000 type:complete len:522 (+) Transcript_10785:178-1743(+)